MFKTYITNETLLFPPCVGDLIPSDSPVRFLSDIVDRLDISGILESYSPRKDGQPPYHPQMLLKVVLYGYLCNIYSTRGLEQDMGRDVHMMWLSSFQRPDHTTLNRFKTRCMPFIKDLFAQLVRILVERGEVELSRELYIDGTTIRSRAARYKIKWRGTAEKYGAVADERLQEALRDLLGQVEEGAANDSAGAGAVRRTPDDACRIAREIEEKLGDRNDKKARSVRSKIRKVREYAGRKEGHDRTLAACGDRCGTAPSDPDCGVMHAKEDGYGGKPTPNYNVQVATQNQYVTNYDVFDTPGDSATALDFVDTCVDENGVKPQAVVEDAGYGCEEVYVGLESRGIEAVVKYPGYDGDCRRRQHGGNTCDRRDFTLTEDGNGLVCPAGRPMRPTRMEPDYGRNGFRSDVTFFTCDHCDGCPFKDRCCVTTNKNHETGRKLGNMRQERKARERLDLPLNRQRLKRRCLEPEPVFGQLKHNQGYTKFRHFSKPKVLTDLGFMFMSLNLRKLYVNTVKTA